MLAESSTEDIVIQSSTYGEIKPQEYQIYHMTKAIVGFQSIREYALIPYEDTPFFILHAVHDDINFIVLPAENVNNYTIELDRDTVEELELEKPEDVATFLIVNLQGDEISVNLRAPILFAPHSRKACQYIIHNLELPIRYVLREGGDEAARS